MATLGKKQDPSNSQELSPVDGKPLTSLCFQKGFEKTMLWGRSLQSAVVVFDETPEYVPGCKVSATLLPNGIVRFRNTTKGTVYMDLSSFQWVASK